MDDDKIVQMYWERNQQAISATAEKYGNYCTCIARNILTIKEDAEECVNDTYLQAWNSIPPHQPDVLSAFLGKITRNLSLNKYKQNRAQKRGGGEITLVLEELKDFISGTASTEDTVSANELCLEIDCFLDRLSKKNRGLFIRRYWYLDSVSNLAQRFRMSENHVSVTLSRIRSKLKTHLAERGYYL